ncbi:hypothetical protein BJY04DRAFT_140764 [Aspergillus karnatakaensis]|uniref:uncharacterized protein n=1 Tax=Aspergillus karnatakaensis TaxID=1810916 RepID=UPI003CCDF624
MGTSSEFFSSTSASASIQLSKQTKQSQAKKIQSSYKPNNQTTSSLNVYIPHSTPTKPNQNTQKTTSKISFPTTKIISQQTPSTLTKLLKMPFFSSKSTKSTKSFDDTASTYSNASVSTVAQEKEEAKQKWLAEAQKVQSQKPKPAYKKNKDAALHNEAMAFYLGHR